MSVVGQAFALAERVGQEFKSLRTNLTESLDSKLSKGAVYTAPGNADGYHLSLDLDFDSTDTTLKVPINVRSRSFYTGLMHAVFWLNESGLARFAGSKGEATVRVYGPPTDSYFGPVFEVWRTEASGPLRKVVWGIDALGRPRLGSTRAIGANVISLPVGEAVPDDIVAGTVIHRY